MKQVKKDSSPRFIFRRLPLEKQTIGGQFEFVRAIEDDKPLAAAGFTLVRGGYEIEMLEPVSELKLLRTDAPLGGLVRWFYKIRSADVLLQDQQYPPGAN